MRLVALPCAVMLAFCSGRAGAAGTVDDPVEYRTAEGSPVDGLRCDLSYQEREWHPGERTRFHANLKVVAPEGLLLDNWSTDVYRNLHVRTPAGKVYRTELGVPVRPPAPDRLKRMERRSGMSAGAWWFQLARGAMKAVDVDTGKVADVSLGDKGEYAFWVTYAVPPNPAAPHAWSGTATSGTMKIRVTDLPVEKRRAAPTAAQEKLLLDALRDEKGPATRFDELNRVVSLTENEGLAAHMVRLARQRPEWRVHLMWMLWHRAQDANGHVAIDGPYLAEYVRLIVEVLEAGPAGDSAGGTFSGRHRVHHVLWPARFVLEYADRHPETAPLRDRVVALARKNARIENVKPDWGQTPCGMTIAEVWDVLLRAGVLRGGMKLDEAEELLGQSRKGKSPYAEVTPGEVRHHWQYPSQLRMAPAMLDAAVKDGVVLKFELHGV